MHTSLRLAQASVDLFSSGVLPSQKRFAQILRTIVPSGKVNRNPLSWRGIILRRQSPGKTAGRKPASFGGNSMPSIVACTATIIRTR